MSEDLAALHTTIEKQALFTLAQKNIVAESGKKMDWVFDFRAIILTPSFLESLTNVLWERLEPLYPFQLGGQETASIPLITALVLKSQAMGKPVSGFYIRKSRKRTDLQQQIEGALTNEPVVLIDDLINSGRTIQRQLLILEQLGKPVQAVFTILRFREESVYTFLTERSVHLETLFTLTDFNRPMVAASTPPLPPRAWYRVVWYGKGGEPTFTYSTPKSTPALDQENVYFGTDQQLFLSLRQDDGTKVWEYRVGRPSRGKSIFSSPAVYNNRVYFGSYDGNVYALDTQSGKPQWIYMEADWVGSSPILAPELNLLFIGLEFGLFKKTGGVVALNMKTGKHVWTYRMDGLVHSTPGYSRVHGAIGIGSNNNVFYLFDAKTGALRWQYATGGEIKASCVFDDRRGLVFFGSFDGKVYGLDIASGAVRFSYATDASIISTPLLGEKVLYVASLDKSLYAIDIETHKLLWQFETGGRIFSTPVFVEDTIIIGSNDGRMYAVDPKTGKDISFFQTTERVVNEVAYNPTTKHIFLPTFANELYCLERTLPSEN